MADQGWSVWRRRGVAAAIALAGLAPGGGVALGQPSAVGFERIDGRDFAGLSLPAEVQVGGLKLRADSASVWDEGRSRRLLLSGDVHVGVGVHTFYADRAVVWIEPTLAGGRQAHKLAFYLDNARSPAGEAGVAQRADRLLVTAVFEGDRTLQVSVLERGRPGDAIVAEGEARLGRRLEEMASTGRVGSDPHAGDVLSGDRAVALAPAEQGEVRFPRRGVLTIAGPDRTLVRGEAENALTITGGVILQFSDVESGESLQVTSQSAVVFLPPGPLENLGEVRAEDVRGVYFEGDVVATNGRYTLRGPRIHYDLQRDRALALDAVFWTYDENRGLPLYVRADAIRQLSESSWSAEGAKVANAAFFEPAFAIGATSVTVTRKEKPDGTMGLYGEASGASLVVNGAGVLALPAPSGEVRAGPLREVRVGSEDGKPIIRTRWDVASTLGITLPEWLTAEALVDVYFDRGPALGADLKWRTKTKDGGLFAYGVYDSGTDVLSSGSREEQDGEMRGLVRAEHRADLSGGWSLFAEGAWVSDPTFIDAYFPVMGQTGREFTSSVYFRNLDGHTLTSIQGRTPLEDFAVNQYLLQSQGYQVQKFPDFLHARVGQDLFGGVVSWFGETRATVMRQEFTEPTLSELGWRRPDAALAGFGLAPNQSLADELRSEGYTEDAVFRFDTRQELSAPLTVGAFNVTPFAVGRLTAYSTDFSEFRTTDNDDTARLWGAWGARVATAVTRVDEFVESRLFDLHRMRHIIEPSATYMVADTNILETELPVYDEGVESLATGRTLRAGMTNTWQTQRGGEGSWRSVDWLVWRLDWTWSDNTDVPDAPIGRWFESRPELNYNGEFLVNDVTMRLTDAVALSASSIYDLKEDKGAQGSAGIMIDHGWGFSTFVEYTDLHVLDSSYLDVGARYELTRKYAVAGAVTYNLEETELQRTGAIISRRFPQWTVEVGVGYDDIRDEGILTISLRPVGVAGEDRRRVLTQGEDASGQSLAPPLPGRGLIRN